MGVKAGEVTQAQLDASLVTGNGIILGNLGATETINVVNGALQVGTLDQACTITLPALPATGEARRMIISLVQGGVGGFLPTFILATGSITWDYAHTPVLADINATAGDVTHFEIIQTSEATYARILNPNIDSNPLSVYASGTVYALTASSAAVDFGTTDPALTLNKPGTYLIFARCRLNYNGATLAANRTTTMKLRRTNNTAADLTNASASATTAIVTTFTGTFIDQTIFAEPYATSNSNDAIALYGSIDVVPSAGSVDVASASIVAVRIGS